jgi:RHS repeat-associated protein
LIVADKERQSANTADSSQEQFSVTAPQISLPKGGGAIRGIGEKFTANPMTGTGSMSVPVYSSPGRAGFGPQLSLAYDSGKGNGPFGFGWSMTVPAITRKTDKGLPQYRDADESDTFILSGAEDLVSALNFVSGRWSRDVVTRTVYGNQYSVHRYRPRVESAFTRIERWLNVADPQDTFWRSISSANVTSWYGKTTASRIADPADPSRVFSWLLCESSDDKGNAAVYEYKVEDAAGVDLAQAHERNRTGATRSAERYVKRVFYGNRVPYFPDLGAVTPVDLPTDWCFELVFDYGEHDLAFPLPQETGVWTCRLDPFSTYRSTFEVRTYRLCRRILMFHHFAEEAEVGLNCLVRSTDLVHAGTPSDFTQPFYSYLLSVKQTGYRRNGDNAYFSKSLPPVEFQYTQALIDETVREVDPESLQNLPYGIDGAHYRWIDLDGEGVSGVLTEQGGKWFYKPNLSPANQQIIEGAEYTLPRFGPVQLVNRKPSLANLTAGRQQLMDLSGDGQLDLVSFDGPSPGFFERTEDQDWEPFAAFASLPVLDWSNPNLKWIDLTGDGLTDLLISEDNNFWWHTGLGSEGFGRGERVAQSMDEEKGPRLVFADSTESIFLGDISGDGLTDLIRIRRGEICYWPNLGYGRFGAKVTMDQSPWFEAAGQFDGRRVRLADIDGSGTADLIYFAGSSVHLYFNQSGNSWGPARILSHFPSLESLSSASAFDLLGNGTTCLVWSSPLPASARRPMRYIDLMGGQKPHLLTQVSNNLGAETRVKYAPSTKFYVADKMAGTPWLTRLPFPVQVVERVEKYDYISRNRFVTRYTYHHGYFDGAEREFRGFGRVDQWDTEELAALSNAGDFPQPTNQDPISNVPPLWSRTWFHTGAFFGGTVISRHMEQEYYSEGDASDAVPGLTTAQLEAMLLDDTVFPSTAFLPDGTRVAYDLSGEEMREACRALRGSILRQETYALDGSDAEDRPYSVSERNYTIELFQPQGPNLHGAFLVHPREAIEFQYERKLFKVLGNTLVDPSAPPPGARNAADPRVTHAFTLAVDPFGNVLKSAAIAYGRRYLDPSLTPADQAKQSTLLNTYTESSFTNPIIASDAYRTPLPAQSSNYEFLQAVPDAAQPDVTNLFRFDELLAKARSADDGLHDLPYEDLNPVGLNAGEPYRRLIARTRVLYRPDDMGASAGDANALLPLGALQSLALPGSKYKMAFTPGLLAQVYQRGGTALLPTPATVLGSTAGDGGGYVDLDGDGHWWKPSGRMFFIPAPAAPAQEATQARGNFFVPRRFEDPYGNMSSSDYDAPHNLMVVRTTDALGNISTALNDYRVLQLALLTDPNGNRMAASLDMLGMVAGTAVMGKATENLGDSLSGFTADLTQPQINGFYTAGDPHMLAAGLLGNATTRIVCDVMRFANSKAAAPNDPTQWMPVFAALLVREMHVNDLGGSPAKIQISFTYSDGYGREIQKKIQAEDGPVIEGGPVVSPRWVGNGWTIFNNKGKPVRKYEPFFSQLALGHQFEFGTAIGVSQVLGYDPLDRVVLTLHPNHIYEKVVFDPWKRISWDMNDTVLISDPATDPDVGGFFALLPGTDYLPTWHTQRAGGGLGPREQDAAIRAAAHAGTPSLQYIDPLARAFQTVVDNAAGGKYTTRMELDIQGNQRSTTDALLRKIMLADYDMLQGRMHQSSMEAGEFWTLTDATGKTIRSWDSRGHNLRSSYDRLRRPERMFVQGTDAANSDPRTLPAEVLFEEFIYGEGQPNDQALNLRTRVFEHRDMAGLVTNMGHNAATGKDEAYDFKGNLLRSSRQFVQDHKMLADWSGAPPAFLPDDFESATQYDAMNRPTASVMPDGSVLHPAYNEANLLEAVAVNLRGAATAASFIRNIDYNAKGQRLLVEYGNNTATVCTYDPETFFLLRQITTRPGFPANQQSVQDLAYTYDPASNITHIQDNADIQNVVFFRNRRVEPSADYIYDAIYRLVSATGREQLGINGGGALPPTATSYHDLPRTGLLSPSDGNAMGIYTEQYQYDAVDNFTQFIHRGSDPVNPGWTRSYFYNEASLLEPGKVSNLLTRTMVSGSTPLNEPYTHDVQGNMASMPQLQAMQWNFNNQLLMSRRQAVNGSDQDGLQHQGERTYYVYDFSGQRVRKITESSAGIKTRERFYLGGFEMYREYAAGGAVSLERETLRVMDDKKCIALVETRTVDAAAAPGFLPDTAMRFQFDNYLGTACLELDENAAVITYEEYYPYGSTSYQAGRTLAEVSLKRYRYTGRERDEETGLNYQGLRYYSEWLGRWTAADRAGLVDGTNLYSYSRGNPIRYVDVTGTDGNNAVQATMQNIGLSNPGPVPQQPLAEGGDPGTITTEITSQNSFSSAVAPGTSATSNLGILLHVRFRVAPNIEFGMQGGGGGTFPLVNPNASNSIGTGTLGATLHVGQQQSTDDSILTQTLHGGYFAVGNLWGQSPQLHLDLFSPPVQSTGFNPYLSAMYAVSRLHNLENPNATDAENDRLVFHSNEFDFNFGLVAQRYGSINGITVDGLVSFAAVGNFALATKDQINTINFEVLAGLNVAGRVDPLDPASPINRVTPLSARAALGIGYVHTFGDYAVGLEVIGGREFGATIGPSSSATDPNAAPITGWGAGAWTGTLNLGISAIRRPGQNERNFQEFLNTPH